MKASHRKLDENDERKCQMKKSVWAILAAEMVVAAAAVVICSGLPAVSVRQLIAIRNQQ